MKITSTTFVAGCSLLLCLAGTPTIVRGSQDMDAMDFVVSPDADHMMGEADGEANDEVFYLLAQKIAALTKAEHTILSLQDQLVASSQELSDKAERLSASETEITKLSEQVKELSFKVESFEAAGKEEVSALTSKLEQAQGEVNRLGDKVKSLETAVEEGEWQVEKAEDEKKSLEKQLADMTEGKEAADVTLEGAKDAAAAAFSRVTFLEKQVKQAKSDALTARKTWEEELETKAKELETKAKEVVDTKAKLRHVIENKYSFSALSADLSAWSKKAGAAMKFW